MFLWQVLDRCEYTIRLQMAEIDRLRAENNDWINGDTDALTCLRRVYNDPTASEGNRIKAAATAIGYERPKVTVAVQVGGPCLLGDRLDQARSMKNGQSAEADRVPILTFLGLSVRNGLTHEAEQLIGFCLCSHLRECSRSVLHQGFCPMRLYRDF
jgi:hypothetical protein